MSADVRIRFVERVNEAERDLGTGLLEVVLEGFIDVAVGLLTGTIGLPITAGRPLCAPPAPAYEDRAPESDQQESAKLTGAAGVLPRWDIGRRGEPCRRRW